MLRNEAGKTHRMVSSMMEQLSMFDYKETMSPLASRLRPESLETFVGQKHLLGEGKLLRQLIERDLRVLCRTDCVLQCRRTCG